MATTLSLTLGALEIGILVSTVLYGITTVQAFLYTERSFKDPTWLRTMIFIIWVFETIHTAFTWILLYSLTVTHYGNPSEIGRTSWSLALTIPFTSCVGATVQVFFAWRVRVLGGSSIIPVFSWTGAFVRLVFGIMLAVFVMTSETIHELFDRHRWIIDAQLILDTAVDVLNTTSLCYFLWRRRTDVKETQRIVDKLIVFTVETGLLTSVCALAILACSYAMPDNFVFVSIFLIYPKLFSNSLFSSLNARKNMRPRTSKFDTRGVWSTDMYLDSHIPGVATQTTSIVFETGLKSLNDRSHGHRSIPPARISETTTDSNDGQGKRAVTVS